MTPQQGGDTTRVVALAGICFAIGQAVQLSNGNLHPESIRWVLGACLLAALVLARVPLPKVLDRAALPLLGVALCWEFSQLLTTPPGMYLRLSGPSAAWPFHAGLVASAVVAGAGLSEAPWLGRAQKYVLLALFIAVGRWLLQASPQPHIDVFYFQRDGAAALLNGLNPYSLRYPDIYGNSPFYGPGLSVNGQLQFGFPYFPLSLLLTLPGHVIGGDYRWTQLIAMAFAAWTMMTVRPGALSRAIAALFLFSPRVLFVLEQGWTEPLVVGALAAVVLVAHKKPAWLPYAVGLLIAVKQYTVFMVPLALLLVPRDQWAKPKALLDFAWKAAVPALLVTVPFILWSPKDFWFDVAQLQVLQPFRDESLSFLAWWKQQNGVQPSTGWAFGMAAVAVAVSLWRGARDLTGFVAAVAVTYLLFFAFNKQAFCNYYYFVIGASALGAVLATRSAAGAPSAPQA